MNHLKLIREFLADKRSPEDYPASGYPFITVSRQTGAGGHLLSYVLLTNFIKNEDEELFRGWHVFDKQLCEIVAEDPLLKDSMESLVRERYGSEFRDFVESLFVGHSSQYTLYKRTFHVVRMLAAIGKVIIVGRAASCVTRDLPGGLHLRLVAPEAERVVWMMKRFHLGKEEARRAVTEQDADRRRMHEQFFNRNPEDPLLYDVVFNTARMDMHDISKSVIGILRDRIARARTAQTDATAASEAGAQGPIAAS